MWTAYRERNGWQAWLLPLSVLLTTVFGWYIMQVYNESIGAGWSIGELIAGILITIILIVMLNRSHPWKQGLIIVGFMVMLIGPTYWAFTPITYGGNSMIPAAGPTGSNGMFGGMGMAMGDRQGDRNGGDMGMAPPNASDDTAQDLPSSDEADPNNEGVGTPPNSGGSMKGGGGMPTTGGRGGAGNRNEEVDTTTLNYLREHNTGETYLFATTDYNQAAPYIIDENEAVITLGGFSGSDPVYTTEKLEQLVKSGQVKYFMVGGMGGRGGSSDIGDWIKEHGTEIPTSEWKTGTDGGSGFGGQTTLYEVKL